jgi:hypothetical protein
LGQYLVDKILNEEDIKNRFSLCFVWNRSYEKIKNDNCIPDECKLENLDDFPKYNADLV